MDRTSRARKVDAGIGNRRRVSWIPNLKWKPKAELFASARESLRKTPSHSIPKQNSEEPSDKQANEEFAVGNTWDELDAELDMHMNASLNESTTPMGTRWRELTAELNWRMNGSLKSSGSSGLEKGVKMNTEKDSKLAIVSQESTKITTKEKERPKKGEYRSSFMEASEKGRDSAGCSHASKKQMKKSKMTDVKSDAETPISEKRPQLEKIRKKPRSHSEKNWMEKLKRTGARPLVSNRSSGTAVTSTSFDSRSSQTTFGRWRSLNLTKSIYNEQKDIDPPIDIETTSGQTKSASRKESLSGADLSKDEASLPGADLSKDEASLQQQIGATTGEMKSSKRKERRTRPDHLKDKSWLRRVVKARNQTWLEQAQIAMKEAKANQKASEVYDDCGPLTENSETAMKETKVNQKSSEVRDECGPLTENSETAMKEAKANQKSSDKRGECCSFTETESDRSNPSTDTRIEHYGACEIVDADDVSVVSLENLFNWLTCTEIIFEASQI
jgi:hypothetical protein